jgi:hypothetical protein
MSNSPPVVEGNLSHDRMVLLDVSKLPEEFKQPGDLPPRQHACSDVPRIFDWCYRLQKDTGNIGNGGFTWVTWPPPAGNQPVNDLAEDASERSSAQGSSPGVADHNICNSPLSAGQSQSWGGSNSDNEDDWEAMQAAATLSGGDCIVNLDVGTANCLAAAPASASVIADDQVGPDSNSSAGEYPHNFANLAPDFDSANPLATAPASPARTGPTADEIVPNSKSPSFDETYPQDFVELARDVLAAAATFPESAAPTGGLSDDIVCPSSAVGIDQLGELVAEATGVSREAAPDKQRKHRKNARKLVAVVGSSENPGMQREPRKAAKKPT